MYFFIHLLVSKHIKRVDKTIVCWWCYKSSAVHVWALQHWPTL